MLADLWITVAVPICLFIQPNLGTPPVIAPPGSRRVPLLASALLNAAFAHIT